VDFLVAAFSAEPRPELTVILEQESRDAAIALSSRWKKAVARTQIVEDGLAGVARMAAQSEAEHIVLGSASSVFLADPAALKERIDEAGDQVVKLSVARTPVEIYFSRREHLARLLAAAAERDTGREGLRATLLDGFLHDSMDLIVDVPGEVLFQNDLMEYYTNNIWVVANCDSPRLHRALSRLPELAEKTAESHVAERGFIRNAWLSSGVEVEGSVEDSILFPNVVVRRNASVFRAVVLNGNRIGSGTEIHSALILPFTAEIPRPTPNIGDNCSIGAKTSTMKNADFPAQIRNGISVIGTNVDIPNGFKAEAATYVAPGVPASVLRKLKLLKKGASVLRERPSRPGGNGSGELR
jgi:hypothetical protein